MAQIWTKVFYYDVVGSVKCGKGYSKVGEIGPTLMEKLKLSCLFNTVKTNLRQFTYLDELRAYLSV